MEEEYKGISSRFLPKQYILNVTHACSSQDVDSLVHTFIREVS